MDVAHKSDIPSPRFSDLQSVKADIARGTPLTANYLVIVLKIDDAVAKYGQVVCKSEALAMQVVVREAPTVPLLRVYAYVCEPATVEKDRCGYLVVEKVPGIPLVEALFRLDERACENIALQLRALVVDDFVIDDTLGIVSWRETPLRRHSGHAVRGRMHGGGRFYEGSWGVNRVFSAGCDLYALLMERRTATSKVELLPIYLSRIYIENSEAF